MVQKNLSDNANGGTDKKITLSLHPDTAYQVKDKHKDLMKKELEHLPPIKEGAIDITGSYVVTPEGEEKVEVGFYIRNGMAKPISFSSIPIVMTNMENEVLAKQVFDLSKLGEIPPFGARPGEIYYNRENIFVDQIPQDNWEISFEEQPQIMEFAKIKYVNLPKNFTKPQIKYLSSFLKKLPPLKLDTIDFSPLQAKLKDDGALTATVIIRNGSKQAVKLKRLNVVIKDAKKRDAAAHIFNDIDNLSIRPLTARLWSFTFPQKSILVDDLDISRWAIQIKK